MITWEQLPVGEKNALSRWINIDREFVNEFEKGLQAKGLIRIVRIDHHRHQNMLTDLGKRVLAQATAGQPEAEGEWYRNETISLIPCNKCGGEVIEFSIPNDIWNHVIRLGGHEHDQEYLCMSCFFEALRRKLSDTTMLAQRNEGLRAQLAASLEREKALKAALEFYADPEAYQERPSSLFPNTMVIPITLEGGVIAREALAAAIAEGGAE